MPQAPDVRFAHRKTRARKTLDAAAIDHNVLLTARAPGGVDTADLRTDAAELDSEAGGCILSGARTRMQAARRAR